MATTEQKRKIFLRFSHVDDEHATDIAKALTASENSHITTLLLQVSAEKLTERGAQVIADGLKQHHQQRQQEQSQQQQQQQQQQSQQSHSFIEQLDIKCDDDTTIYDSDAPPPLKLNGDALRLILEAAVLFLHVQHLKLDFSLNTIAAEKLSEVLLAITHHHNNDDNDNDNNNRWMLQTLYLNIGSDLTPSPAKRLANGLRHAKIQCLELQMADDAGHLAARTDVMKTIYRAAIESVEKLVLENDLFDQSASAFGLALAGYGKNQNNDNTTLQACTFTLNNSLSRKAATKLANGIRRSHLVHLDMSRHLYDDGDHEPVEFALYHGVSRSSTIQHLTIGEGFHDGTGFSSCLSPQLRSLVLHPWMIMERVPAFLRHLQDDKAPNLTTLVIGQMLETEQDILTFCAALSSHLPSLTNLAISCKLAFEEDDDEKDQPKPTTVSDDGTNAVPPQQREDDDDDDLDSRQIRTTSTEQLMTAVANHPSLVCLNLNECYDIGFAGLTVIGSHLPNVRLEELHFSSLEDSYDPKDEVASVQRAFQRASQALVTGVKSNHHLQILDFDDDLLPPPVQEEVDLYLDVNKYGRHLMHSNRDGENKKEVPMGLWSHVLAKCGRNNKASVLYYYLREQPCLVAAGMCHYDKSSCEIHGPVVERSSKRRRTK